MSTEDRLLQILGSWREHRSRGEAADPEEVVEAHPDLADELRACFATLQALDEVLAEEGGIAGSVLSRLSEGGEPWRPVVLRDPDERDAATPMVRVGSAAGQGVEGRYQVVGEIARGGVGVVLKGLDLDLGRSVAMKVVLEEHRGNQDILQRFVEEAQIGGQLQHPGIVPVYEIGLRKDRRPYFTMKLVKGRTLSALLADRGDVAEDRQRFLSIFESVCQTVAYAHARGVIHRDLKPANVMVGAFGEVLVVDWGMGKVLRQGGVDDERKSRDRADRTLVETVRSESVGSASVAGSVLGTLRYMPPEQARGDLARVDERSDVFSLGATLCEILTGSSPYSGATQQELLRQAADARLEDAHERLARCGADEELVSLTRRCLSPGREARPKDAGELAREVRAYLSAVEERARRARIEAAEANARAAREEARAERARAAAEKERLRADHARRARRTGAIVLAATVVVAAVVSALIDARRREAQAARHETQQALTRVLQLADVKRARDLVEQEETLWPIHPDRVAAMAHWLERAEALLSRRAGHEQSLADVRGRALPYTPEDRARDQDAAQSRLREITELLAAMEQELRLLDGEEAEASRAAYARRAEALTAERDDLLARAGERRTWRFASDEDAWRHQTLTDLLGDVRLLEGERVAQVRARKESAASLRTRSIDEHRDAWAQTIADVRAAKGYAGLVLVPQQGLVPLGPDPQSGLLEFAHVGSGSIPHRAAETGALVCAEDAAIVLVLLPGGTDWLGAQASDPNGPNYDPDAGPDEGPVHQVTLTPFLLAKHELTQSQWTTLTGGQRPSGYPAGRVVAGRHLTERNPVEQVSWELCARWMTRHRLELPTEAQWEYACRAGTDTPWVTGREMADVGRVANVADATMRRYEPTREGVLFALEIEDGHGVHAPVGSFAPNSFGLHDMHGNVWEWCSDFHGPYTAEPATDPLGEAAYAGRGGRIARGGAFFAHPRRARSSYRRNHSPRAQYFVTGLRPAATLQR